jgi:hypothetical protein
VLGLKLKLVSLFFVVLFLTSLFVVFVPIVCATSYGGSWQVGASSDDCSKEYTTTWTFSLVATRMRMGYSSSGLLKMGAAMRWTGVTIPQGATITSAVVEYYASDTRAADDVNVYIRGEKSVNALTFVNLTDYDGRTWTSATVDWTMDDYTSGNWYNSTDVSSVVQEVVSQVGWVSGNSLVIEIQDYDGRSTTLSGCNRQFRDYDYATADGAYLFVTWTVGGGVQQSLYGSLSVSFAVSGGRSVLFGRGGLLSVVLVGNGGGWEMFPLGSGWGLFPLGSDLSFIVGVGDSGWILLVVVVVVCCGLVGLMVLGKERRGRRR